MKVKKIILIMGLAGSGKGTQSQLLAKLLGFSYFSMGEVLREYGAKDNDLGQEIRNLIDEGMIVTEDIIEKILFATLKDVEAEGLIIDGYPRTLYQIQYLEKLMHENGINDLEAIFLDVDQRKLIKRILKRAEGSAEARVDDNPEGIQKRFKEYEYKTAEAKKYLEEKGLLHHINGDQPIEKVHEDIKQALGV